MAAAVPPCALLGVLAKPVIVTVYGDAWAAAAAALSFLAVLGLLRVGYELAYDCLAAAARQRDLLAVQGWWLAALIPVLIVAAHWRGIQGVGIGHVLVASVLVAPAFAWALQRAGIPARLLLQACGRPFAGGVLMAAAAYAVLRLCGGATWALWPASAVALLLYLPVVWPLRHELRPAPRTAPLEPAGAGV
jgi:PST family polysaccharide transporter